MNSRLDLTLYFEQHKFFNKGVEVGSYKGEYAKEILKNWTGKLFLIDVWKKLDNTDYVDCSNQYDYFDIIKNCMTNINGSENRCSMIRSDSVNASDLFKDESLDFIYIDANHKYEYVKQDLEIWFPKLRKGGVFAGHDYLKMNWDDQKDKHIWNSDFYHGVFGVNPAVDEFCKKFNFDLTITKEWFGSWIIKK